VKAGGLQLVAVIAAMLMLSACGERAQLLDGSAKSWDAPAWSVSAAANPAFTAPGWKAGDKTAWQEQMRRRNQAHNDYVR
jgi:hypothetical protein